MRSKWMILPLAVGLLWLVNAVGAQVDWSEMFPGDPVSGGRKAAPVAQPPAEPEVSADAPAPDSAPLVESETTPDGAAAVVSEPTMPVQPQPVAVDAHDPFVAVDSRSWPAPPSSGRAWVATPKRVGRTARKPPAAWDKIEQAW